MQHIKGPDFPTGGDDPRPVRASATPTRPAAAGCACARAPTSSSSTQGKEAIIVTELPYLVKKGGDSGLIRKIADLVHEKKITEISDLRDESDRHGMRLVIELKRDVIPKVVLNKLYKHTPMQTTFGVNMVALVDGVPRTLSLRDVIRVYVEHQREVIVRRAKYELRTLEARVHLLEGLLIALDNLDAVIELIRASRDRDDARAGLMERFGLSHIQAQAILDLRLPQLTALEADAIKREHADVIERIRELRELLGDEDKVLALIKEELLEIAERYGDERRTEITPAEDDLDIEDLIADQQMVITITKSGYIKSLPLATYRQQRRGGVGVTGMDMKDDDYIEHLFVCSTHDYLLFFTNRGKVYRSKVYDLPEAGRARPRAAPSSTCCRCARASGSSPCSRRATSPSREYLVFATRDGIVKKTEFQAYNTPIKADGIIAINIRDDDELVAVRRVDQGDEILMVSRAGLTVRFREERRPRDGPRHQRRARHGRRRQGQRGPRDGRRPGRPGPARRHRERLRQAHADRPVPQDLARRQGRQDDHSTESKGALAGALVVQEHQELVFISQNGMVQRTACAASTATAARPRASGHEHPRGRRGLRGRAGRRVRRPDRRRRAATAPRPVLEAGGETVAIEPVAEADGDGTGRASTRLPARTESEDAWIAHHPRRLGVVARPLASATLERPEKGGGPKLSDSYSGTLEVSGR